MRTNVNVCGLQVWKSMEDEELQSKQRTLAQRKESLNQILGSMYANLEHFSSKLRENPSSEVSMTAVRLIFAALFCPLYSLQFIQHQ
jgi:hypothetical protein